MLNFKSLTLIAAFFFSVVACDGPTEKSENAGDLNGGSGPFIVFGVNGTSFKTLERVDKNGNPLKKDESLDYYESWNLPKAIHYTFKACVKSRVTRKPIVGRHFTVVDGLRVFKSNLPTNEEGCFWWKELMAFNYFADSKYLELKREIQGSGDFKGGRSVNIYVNPWASYRKGDRDREVVFEEALPEEHVVRGQGPSRIALAGEGQTYPLYMANLRMKSSKIGNIGKGISKFDKDGRAIIENSKNLDTGIMLEVLLSMKPQVAVKGLDINQEPIGLRHGKFRVWSHIMASNVGNLGKESLILNRDHNSAPYQDGYIDPRTGLLTVDIKMPITKDVAEGRIKLLLRVKAMGGPAPSKIKHFDSIYLVGEFNKLRGDHTPKFSPADHSFVDGKFAFDFDRYLQGMDPKGYANLKAAGLAFARKPFIFDKMEQRWLRIQPGETATVRTIEYRASTCISDPGTGQRQARMRFLLTRIRDNKAYPQHPVTNPNQEIMTDDFGCLAWTDEVTHQYYKPEKPLSPEVIIRRQALNGIGGEKTYVEETLKLKINPWDDKFTFGEDTRRLSAAYIKSLDNLPQIVSRFYLDGFQYYTTGFRYEIDEFMNLLVKKTVLMKMRPKVLRYSSIVNGRKQVEPLRDGIYLMKVALEKNYLDPSLRGPIIEKDEYDHHLAKSQPGKIGYSLRLGTSARSKTYFDLVTKFVKVQEGNIITPIEFTMRDLRLMRIRTQFLVQLETIHEPALIIASNVGENWLMKDVVATKQEIADLRKEKSDLIKKNDGVLLSKEQNEAVLIAAGELQAEIEVAESLMVAQREIVNGQLERLIDRLVQRPAFSKKYLGTYLREIGIYEEPEAPPTLSEVMQNVPHPSLSESLSGITRFNIESEAYTGEVMAPTDKADDDLFKLTNYGLDDKKLRLRCDIDREVNHTMENPDLVKCLLETMNVPTKTISQVQQKVVESDFTNEKTEINADYSLLVDRDSGLEQRSFVGPLTLLLNSNASFVRATDRLDEFFCKKSDCSAGDNNISVSYPIIDQNKSIIDRFERDVILDKSNYEDAQKIRNRRVNNAAYEQSKYFGSIRHLYNKNIDDLIVDYDFANAQSRYKLEMQYSRLIYNYLESYELQYVSLTDFPLMKFKGDEKKCNKIYHKNCFVQVSPSNKRIISKNDFLYSLNGPVAGFARLENIKKICQDPATMARARKNGLSTRVQDCVDDSVSKLTINEFSNYSKVREEDLLFLIRYVYDRDLSAMEREDLDSFIRAKGSKLSPEVAKHNREGIFAKAGRIYDSIYNAMFETAGSMMIQRGNNVKKALIPGLGERLCQVFFKDLGRIEIDLHGKSKDQSIISDKVRYQSYKSCLEKVKDGDVSKVFSFDRKMNIYETGEYRYKGGKQLNIRVSSGSYFLEQDVNYLTHGIGGTISTPAVGKGSQSKLGLMKALLGVIGVNVRGGLDGENSVRLGNRSGEEEGAYLVMQTAAFDLEVLNHEKCIIIRQKAQFLMDNGIWTDETLAGVGPRDREKLLGGYFICEGKRGSEQSKPTAIRERYYYMTQHFTQGDMLDNGDLYNLPFNLGFRGAEGLRLMYSAIRRDDDEFNKIFPMADEIKNPEVSILNQDTVFRLMFGRGRGPKEPLWPLQKLIDTYLNFRPSFPGLYTVLDELTEQANYPWTNNPHDSFDRGLIRTGWGLYDKARQESRANLLREWELWRENNPGGNGVGPYGRAYGHE